MYFWVIRVVLISDPDTVHKGVLLFLRFTNLRTRCTALANRMTGHNTLSPVLRCDRRSNFSPFFLVQKRDSDVHRNVNEVGMIVFDALAVDGEKGDTFEGDDLRLSRC